MQLWLHNLLKIKTLACISSRDSLWVVEPGREHARALLDVALGLAKSPA